MSVRTRRAARRYEHARILSVPGPTPESRRAFRIPRKRLAGTAARSRDQQIPGARANGPRLYHADQIQRLSIGDRTGFTLLPRLESVFSWIVCCREAGRWVGPAHA